MALLQMHRLREGPFEQTVTAWCILAVENSKQKFEIRFMKPVIPLTLLMTLAASAQDPRGAITGQVMDSSLAVIPGVSVRATNLETNIAASAVSNAQGAY